jgi:hypothetical protein
MGNNPYRKRDQPPAPMLANAGEQSPLLAPGLLQKQREQKSSRRKRKRDTSTQQRLCEYQYWFPPNQSHLVPTKKAITLSPTEYSQLKDPTSIMDDFVPESTISLPIGSHEPASKGTLTCDEIKLNVTYAMTHIFP